MTLDELDRLLLSKPGAEKLFKPEWEWWCYQVGGKNFAAEFTVGSEHKAPYAGRHLLSLKCDPEQAEELRAEWPDAVFPGFYLNKRHWISIDLDSAVPDDLIADLCERSYRLVFAKLTKAKRDEIASECV